jgi:hypothetical protein
LLREVIGSVSEITLEEIDRRFQQAGKAVDALIAACCGDMDEGTGINFYMQLGACIAAKGVASVLEEDRPKAMANIVARVDRMIAQYDAEEEEAADE